MKILYVYSQTSFTRTPIVFKFIIQIRNEMDRLEHSERLCVTFRAAQVKPLILLHLFNSSSAAVRTGLLWLDNTSTSLHVRFESNSIHHQLQYALGSFGLTTQAQASMYASNLIQFIISCSTQYCITAADDDLN